MKSITIDAPVEYISGYLRYGHYEGTIELADEEFEKFKENPQQWLKDNDATDVLSLVVDDWSIEDVGSIDEVNWSEN